MSLHWTSLHCDSAEQYLALCGPVSIVAFAHQQPGGGDTPGVAVAPVALAGAIISGVARFIVVHSAQADVFGVGGHRRIEAGGDKLRHIRLDRAGG